MKRAALCMAMILASVSQGCHLIGSKKATSSSASASGNLNYGIWVSEPIFRSKSISIDFLDKAKKAGLNTVYPVAFHEGCAYFNTKVVPACRAPGGQLEEFTALAVERGFKVIPWFEKFIQSTRIKHPEVQYEKERLYIEEDAKVLDLDNTEVRNRLLDALLDASKIPGVSGVHIDDHMEYYADSGADPAKYGPKLTAFVNWLGRKYHAKSGNKIFEISHHNLFWASSKYFAHWDQWTEVDRVIVQCYKNSVQETLDCADQERTQPKVTGFGFLAAQDATSKSPAEIAQIMKSFKQSGLSGVIWKADALYLPGVPEALGAVLR